LTEYLLGGLAEHEREALERSIFTDDDFFLELEEAEHDLIDRYVRGSLSAGDRSRFEKAFLSTPDRERRVEMARYLTAWIDKQVPPAKTETWWRTALRFVTVPPFRPVAAMAAACLVVLTGAIVYFRQEQLPVREQARVETQDVPRQAAPPARPEQTVPRRSPVIPAFLLAPGLVRGGGGVQVIRRGEAESIRLQLLLEEAEYQRYTASIETPEGRTVFSRAGLTAASLKNSRIVMLTVPVSALEPGDYVVRLSGAVAGGSESVAEYTFRTDK
jgi:anti-sigma factor RsiW